MRAGRMQCVGALLWLVSVAWPTAAPSGVAAGTGFTSPRPLLLPRGGLPRGFRYRGVFVQSSVERWDGDIAPIVAIDQRSGWLIAAQETLVDAKGQDAMLSVQLFQRGAGARQDFAQFFTNQHPQSRFVPDTTWLGGRSVRGVGEPATQYHILDMTSPCPGHRAVGVSFVYRNGIFSAGGCALTLGDRGAMDLARRLYRRAERA